MFESANVSSCFKYSMTIRLNQFTHSDPNLSFRPVQAHKNLLSCIWNFESLHGDTRYFRVFRTNFPVFYVRIIYPVSGVQCGDRFTQRMHIIFILQQIGSAMHCYSDNKFLVILKIGTKFLGPWWRAWASYFNNYLCSRTKWVSINLKVNKHARAEFLVSSNACQGAGTA